MLANSQQLFSKIDCDFLSCSICTLLYSSPSDKDQINAPKTLACLHTFCKQCIEKSISPDATEISCFICRAPTCINKSQGIESIKTNFMIQELISTFHPSTSELPFPHHLSNHAKSTDHKSLSSTEDSCACESTDICETCPTDSNTPAALYCRQCEMPVCTPCAHNHLKTKRGIGHELMSFEESKKNNSRRCSTHKSELYSYVCESCPNVLCCVKCLNDGGHEEKGHKITALEEFVHMKKEQMQEACNQSQELLKAQYDILASIEGRIKDLRIHTDSARSQINESFDKLTELFNSRRNEWISEIESQDVTLTKVLSAEKKAVQLHIRNGDLFIGRAKDMVENMSDIDFLEKSSKLMDILSEGNKGLLAPFTLTGIAPPNGTVGSQFTETFSELLEANPFLIPELHRLPIQIKLDIPGSAFSKIHETHSTTLLGQLSKVNRSTIASWVQNRLGPLLYSSQVDGLNSRAWHTKCDNKGPTLLLGSLPDGTIVGAFVTYPWNSTETDTFFADSTAFLFIVETTGSATQYLQTGTKREQAICHTNPQFYGPAFGFDLYFDSNFKATFQSANLFLLPQHIRVRQGQCQQFETWSII